MFLLLWKIKAILFRRVKHQHTQAGLRPRFAIFSLTKSLSHVAKPCEIALLFLLDNFYELTYSFFAYTTDLIAVILGTLSGAACIHSLVYQQKTTTTRFFLSKGRL